MSLEADDWRQLESCIYDAVHWLEMLVIEGGYGLARARLCTFCRIVQHFTCLIVCILASFGGSQRVNRSTSQCLENICGNIRDEEEHGWLVKSFYKLQDSE
jgi:hypothetical protein